MIEELRGRFSFREKRKVYELRSNKAKEKFADSLLRISHNLFTAAMVWITAPFLLRFNKLVGNMSEYGELGFFKQILFLIVDYMGKTLSVYFVLFAVFVLLVALGASSRMQAMDIYDDIERKNRMKRK